MEAVRALEGLDATKLGLVVVAALAMLAIAVHAIVTAVRRRAAERAADAARLDVRVRIPLAASDAELADRWCDPLDEHLSATGAGEVLDARSHPGTSPETGTVELGVRLHAGSAGLPSLKAALSDIGAPTETLLTWRVKGVEARDRLGRPRD